MADAAFAKMWNLNSRGARDIVERVKNSGSFEEFLAGKKGRGRKVTVSNPENVADVSELVTNQPKMSIGDLSRETGLKPTALRRIAKDHLNLQNATQVKAQRITKVNIDKRLQRCADWVAKMDDSWSFDPRKVLWTDEKSFRIGAVGGGNQNHRVLISNKAKKYECKAEDLQREDGAWQGGHRVLVCLGVTWYGVCRAYFAPKG